MGRELGGGGEGWVGEGRGGEGGVGEGVEGERACWYRVIFRSVVTKKRRESTHARDSPFKIPSKMRARAVSRRFFVTTDLKNPVDW